MGMSFFHINKHFHIPLLIILCFPACLSTGCRQEKKQSFKEGLLELYGTYEKAPFKQEEFEQILTWGINSELYYYPIDYMQNYIGETIDYLIYFDNPSLGFYGYRDYVVLWSPEGNSGLDSSASSIRFYDSGKTEYINGHGSLGDNINDMYFDKESPLFERIDQYLSIDAKFLYEGSMTIPEPAAPIASEFDAKEGIIGEIMEAMEQHSYFDMEFKDKLDIYIMEFNENDAVTSILLIPDDNMNQAVKVSEYRIVEKEPYVRAITRYTNFNFEIEDELTRRHTHFAERMMESAIHKIIYPVK